MNRNETVLFEKCPLCRQAEVSKRRVSRIGLPRPEIYSCPNCSAEFEAKGGNRFQLVFCEPHRLVDRHDCGERVLRGCYLDAILSREEWAGIAKGGELGKLSDFLELSDRFISGSLPIEARIELPFALAEGENLHYVSSQVYLDDQKSGWSRQSDAGHLYLTSQRLVFVSSKGTEIISLNNIEKAEDCPPGFVVREKDSFQPYYFFPPRYDPVFAAVSCAMRKLKKRR